MSDQHQAAGEPAKPERRVEHHRERQATRAALNVSDLEDVLDPPSVHNTATPGLPGPTAKPRRFRHWKQPFWKRRSNGRRTRNETIAHLDDQ